MFRVSDDGPVQDVLPAYRPPLTQLGTAEELPDFLGQTFDLAALPSIRVAWLQNQPDEGRLFIAAHPFAVDGVSARFLRKEIEQYLQGVSRAEPQSHPVDIALAERSAEGRKNSSIRVNEMIRLVSSVPCHASDTGDQALIDVMGRVASTTLMETFASCAHRYKISHSAPPLAFYRVLLQLLWSPTPETHSIYVMSANRWERDRRQMIGHLNITVPVIVHTTKWNTSRELLQATGQIVKSLMSGSFDYSLSEFNAQLIRTSYETGRLFNRVGFNYLQLDPRDVAPTGDDAATEEAAVEVMGEGFFSGFFPLRFIFGRGTAFSYARAHRSYIELKFFMHLSTNQQRILEKCVTNIEPFTKFFANPDSTIKELREWLATPDPSRTADPWVRIGVDLVDLAAVRGLVLRHPDVIDVNVFVRDGVLRADVHVDRPTDPASIHWHVWKQLPDASCAVAPALYRILQDGSVLSEGSGRTGQLALQHEPAVDRNVAAAINEVLTRVAGVVLDKHDRGLILSGGSTNDAVTVAEQLPAWLDASVIDLLDPYRTRRELVSRCRVRP